MRDPPESRGAQTFGNIARGELANIHFENHWNKLQNCGDYQGKKTNLLNNGQLQFRQNGHPYPDRPPTDFGEIRTEAKQNQIPANLNSLVTLSIHRWRESWYTTLLWTDQILNKFFKCLLHIRQMLEDSWLWNNL